MERGWGVVTGASTGIGRQCALALGRMGWNVLVHCRRSIESAQAVAAELRSMGRSADVVTADLQDQAGCDALIDAVWQRTPAVDVWVQNAGVDLLTGANASLSFDQKLLLATQVDLWGTLRTCREVGRRMRERGVGSIITIGWDQAETGMDGDSGQLFAAIKGGVMAFTKSLARSLAPTVRVNCVAPGWIKTAWGQAASEYWQQRVQNETPLGRWGTPDEVAAAVAFLASENARFVTGQILHVNGGAVCK